MYDWNKGGNLPLYGVGLGILALFFATWIAHRQQAQDETPAARQVEVVEDKESL